MFDTQNSNTPKSPLSRVAFIRLLILDVFYDKYGKVSYE